MSEHTFVWAHGLFSSVAHEEELGLFDWSWSADWANVRRYDARGHGAGPVQYEPRAYRWPGLVDDMLWVEPQGPIVAGGAGMGAATALFAAVLAPRRVEALVLVIPPVGWEERPAHAALLASWADLVETRGVPALIEVLRTRPPARVLAEGAPVPDLAMRHLVGHLATMDEKVVPAILRGAAASDLPAPEEVRGVIVPTLVLAWEDDPAHPVGTARRLADLLLQPELHLARDLVEVRTWPALVRDFLARL